MPYCRAVVKSIFWRGFAIPERCGTVICEDDVMSLCLLIEVWASFSVIVLLGSFGSLGVGLNRSGNAVCASRVSYGKNDAFGSPVRSSQHYR